MSWVAVGVAVASALLGAYNTKRTADKQDDRAAAAIRAQRSIQDEQNARITKTLQDVQASSPSEERKSAESSYLEQVRNAQAMARANLDKSGVSEDYDKAAAGANVQAQDYAKNIAGLMSRMDAPINQRTNEGFAFGNLTTDIGQTQRRSAGQQWIDQLKLSGVRRNPMLDLVSQVGSAYASSAGGGKGGAASSSGGGGGGMLGWIKEGY